ncbi:SAF domain-containing protein [Frankia sp. Cas3]|uniref:SAF domain-containing protein n=1 Tax=Frankia sp. Cas3 TaxID=3073926 RepID=UPI002AD2C069|nr:SAF domain-containing protein [Frankia sp. Cas3]
MKIVEVAMWLAGRTTARIGEVRAWRLAVGARRRVLAGVFAGLALLLTAGALRSSQSLAGTAVVVAASELEGGAIIAPTDVRIVSLPVDAVPVGTARRFEEAVGRTLAAPVGRGEPITDARFLGPGLLTQRQAAAGLVATPVRVSDAGSVLFLRVGDRVDVLAASTEMAVPDASSRNGSTTRQPGVPTGDTSAGPTTEAGTATVVASDVTVLAVLRPRDAAEGVVATTDGALLFVAAPPRVAAILAGAAVHARLSVTVLGRRAS